MYDEIFDNFLDKINGFDSFFNGVSAVKENYKLVYGEYSKDSFEATLDILKDFNYLNTDKKLLDLGSGIGKVVMAMHYTNYFKQVDGVEIVKTLVDDGWECVKAYGQIFDKNIDNIHLYNTDFANFDISDYDILISNTTTDDRVREMLRDKITNEAKQNAIVISSITSFKCDVLKEVRKFVTKFSWGTSYINACIKI